MINEVNFINEVKDIFDLIINSIIILKGKNYKYIMNYEEFYLTTKDFIFTFDQKEYIFIISFTINQTGKSVAEIMSSILNFIELEELIIMDDNSYDNDNKKIIFGSAALENKYLQLLKKNGKEICPMCETIVPINEITKDNICKFCKTNYEKFTWC
jgi:hypothetical protein